MEMNLPERKAQIIYFSHGGGPLPILGDPGHQAMIDFMTRLPSQLVKPDAIIVISAHWEERAATLLGSPNPPMFYDYYGFPPKAYEITYSAPGNPVLAENIAKMLQSKNIPAQIDPKRGYDHGLFIPLKMMYPGEDIPCIQLSLLRGLDPAAHLELGKALRSLLAKNILVIGSGFSFHNMQSFSWQGNNKQDPANDAFQDWLVDVCTFTRDETERERLLIEWELAPSARYCHPREEHLLPLHVCQGLAGRSAKLIFDDEILGKRGVAFQW